MHRDFTRTLPCGCSNGHFCPEAEAKWRELMGWLLNMSHPTAVSLVAEWDEHFAQDCTCDPDPNRESAVCPACVAAMETEGMPF